MITPPRSVPGPHRPAALPPGLPSQRQPGVRYYTVIGSESLSDIAMARYGNPLRAVDIFQANSAHTFRADRTRGFLRTPGDTLNPGMILLLP